MARHIDITGQTFGQLTALDRVGTSPAGLAVWRWQCVCGGQRDAIASEVKRGNTLSCGCAAQAQRRTNSQRQCHAYSRANLPRERKSWERMLSRCYDPTDVGYADYGGRGITVCHRWRESFPAFFEDMGLRPLRHTLDRFDVEAPYGPDNCRWATPREQANNRRNNHQLTYAGRTQTVAQWARELGVTDGCIHNRIRRGWPLHKVLAQPANH